MEWEFYLLISFFFSLSLFNRRWEKRKTKTNGMEGFIEKKKKYPMEFEVFLKYKMCVVTTKSGTYI